MRVRECVYVHMCVKSHRSIDSEAFDGGVRGSGQTGYIYGAGGPTCKPAVCVCVCVCVRAHVRVCACERGGMRGGIKGAGQGPLRHCVSMRIWWANLATHGLGAAPSQGGAGRL